MDGSSSIVKSLSGALAVLGALGSDAMGSVMLSQCVSPQLYCTVSRLSQILDGACQPMVGPTFKLGSMLTVHTACAIAGRINDWDPCAGVVPLREDQAQCYSMDGHWIKQMGSCVYIGVQDHATAVVNGLQTQQRMNHHYIKMRITGNPTYRSTVCSPAWIVGTSWPLCVAVVVLILKEWLWATIILLGWVGWLFVSLSAGSDVKPGHCCDSDCSEMRQYLLNDQGTTKSLIEYTVCIELDDEARRKLPKRHTRSRMLRLVGSILMTVHFPIGLIATCYSDSTGALIWVLVQFVGLIAGVRWFFRESRLVRYGIGCTGGLAIKDEVSSFERWQDVLDLVNVSHWPHIKHKYT